MTHAQPSYTSGQALAHPRSETEVSRLRCAVFAFWLVRLVDAGTRVVARFGLYGLLGLSASRARAGAQRRKRPRRPISTLVRRANLHPRYDDKSSPVCVEPRLVIPRVEMW